MVIDSETRFASGNGRGLLVQWVVLVLSFFLFGHELSSNCLICSHRFRVAQPKQALCRQNAQPEETLGRNFPQIVSSALTCSHLLPSDHIRESQRVFKSSVFIPDPCKTPRNTDALWLTQTPRISALGVSQFGPVVAEFSRF